MQEGERREVPLVASKDRAFGGGMEGCEEKSLPEMGVKKTVTGGRHRDINQHYGESEQEKVEMQH